MAYGTILDRAVTLQVALPARVAGHGVALFAGTDREYRIVDAAGAAPPLNDIILARDLRSIGLGPY